MTKINTTDGVSSMF